MMRAIVLVLDHLSARYLGPYGNTWIPTPGFNQLAATSLLAETMIASSNDLEDTYQSFLLGQHPLQPESGCQALLTSLADRGGKSTLISSSSDLLSFSVCTQFTQQLHVPVHNGTTSAENIGATAVAGLLGEVLHWLETTGQGEQEDLLWIHSSSLEKCWDAPLELREIFRGEEDPDISTITTPPIIHQDSPLDPDQLLQINYPYAAQVCVIDTCLAALYNWLAESPPDTKTLLIVTACRALPLGIHGTVGYDQAPLYSDQLHVPLFASILDDSPGNQPAMSRTQRILQSESVYHTLMQWFELSADAGSTLATSQQSILPCFNGSCAAVSLASEFAISKNSQRPESSVYTPAWFARLIDHQVSELFVKPDDRWDINEIAQLRGDVSAAIEELVAPGRITDIPQKLPELLWNQLAR